MNQKIPKAPSHLEKAGKSFWRRIMAEFAVQDPHHLELLTQACRCLDRIEQARSEVATAGAYYQDRFFQPKPHPGLAVERDQRVLFCRLLREMALDIAPPESRPPARY